MDQCYFWDLVPLDGYLWVILELKARVLATVANIQIWPIVVNLGAFAPDVLIQLNQLHLNISASEPKSPQQQFQPTTYELSLGFEYAQIFKEEGFGLWRTCL